MVNFKKEQGNPSAALHVHADGPDLHITVDLEEATDVELAAICMLIRVPFDSSDRGDMLRGIQLNSDH